MIHSTYREKPAEERHPFRGDSCYPISPVASKNEDTDVNVISKGDQMLTIMKLLGDQNSNDLSFITNKKALAYIQNLQQGKMKINFEEMFPDTTQELLGLLSELLQFNPGFRPTAKECL